MKAKCLLIVAILLGTALLACDSAEIAEVTVDEPAVKEPQPTQQTGIQHSDLFVFVGEKMEVVEYTPPNGEVWFDSAFDAKYRVIQSVYGEFEGDIIDFRVFDHYGYPPFAKYRHALLFVIKEKGKLYHEKYLYHPVFKTIEGSWAACGDPYLSMEPHRKPYTPKPLSFAEPVVFKLKGIPAAEQKVRFPQPYFEIDDGKAICKMGAYVDELFQINRNAYLRARGIGQ